MPMRSQGYCGDGRGLSGLHWVCFNGRGPHLGPPFLTGESQGRGSLVGCRLWGRIELDTTERLCFHYKQLYANKMDNLEVMDKLLSSLHCRILQRHQVPLEAG